jgi:hypothetical protein
MRKIVFSLMMIAVSHISNAQVIKIPDAAKRHFAETFPDAKDPKWSNNISSYTSEFKDHDYVKVVGYTVDGKWNYTETHIPDSMIPHDVKESFAKSKYRDWKIKSIVQVQTSKMEKSYRVEAVKGIQKKYVFYDKDGVTVKENIGL